MAYFNKELEDYKQEKIATLVGDLRDANQSLVNELHALETLQKDIASSRKRVQEIQEELKSLGHIKKDLKGVPLDEMTDEEMQQTLEECAEYDESDDYRDINDLR